MRLLSSGRAKSFGVVPAVVRSQVLGDRLEALMDLAGGPNRICTCALVAGSEYSCTCQEVTGPHWFREPPWCPPVRTVTVTVTEYLTTASTVTVTSVSTATVTMTEQRNLAMWSQLTVEVFMLGLMLPLLGLIAGVLLVSSLKGRAGAGQ